MKSLALIAPAIKAFLAFWLASLLYAAFPFALPGSASGVFAELGNEGPPATNAYFGFVEMFVAYRLPFLIFGVVFFGALATYLWTPKGAPVRSRVQIKGFAIQTLGLFCALVGSITLLANLALGSADVVR